MYTNAKAFAWSAMHAYNIYIDVLTPDGCYNPGKSTQCINDAYEHTLQKCHEN